MDDIKMINNNKKIILEKVGANYFGTEILDKEGKIHSQLAVIRGNGDLELTEEGIYFLRWLPRKEFFIPLNLILKTEIGTKHNGKGYSKVKILKIYYKENDGVKIFGIAVGGKLSITKGLRRNNLDNYHAGFLPDATQKSGKKTSENCPSYFFAAPKDYQDDAYKWKDKIEELLKLQTKIK